jgi:hypothetical protein
MDESWRAGILGIGVGRKRAFKWLFLREKTTFHGSQKVYMYSEKALPRSYLSGARRGPECAPAAGQLHERFRAISLLL